MPRCWLVSGRRRREGLTGTEVQQQLSNEARLCTFPLLPPPYTHACEFPSPLSAHPSSHRILPNQPPVLPSRHSPPLCFSEQPAVPRFSHSFLRHYVSLTLPTYHHAHTHPDCLPFATVYTLPLLALIGGSLPYPPLLSPRVPHTTPPTSPTRRGALYNGFNTP